MFCEAIVTTYSGSAMPTAAATVKCGATATGCGHIGPSVSALMCVVVAISTTATTTAAGTA